MNKSWKSFTSFDSLTPQVLKDGTEKNDLYCSGSCMGGSASPAEETVHVAFEPKFTCLPRAARRATREEEMDPHVQLVRVVQEMQAKINTLEKENQALRMMLTSDDQRTPGSEGQSGDEREEEVTDSGNLGKVPGQPPATLHGSIATGTAPDVRENQGNVMIVRRYSVSSPIHLFAAKDPWKPGKRHPNSRNLEAQGTVQSLACSSIKKKDNEEKMLAEDSFTSKNHGHSALPEPVLGCRDKIKTVSFLLPMDTAPYSKNTSSLKCPANQTASQLSTIAE
ncbi:putative coiled-coil domain-containing protein 195 [Glossophaga mutica]